MELFLYDRKLKTDVLVELNIQSTVPTNDIYVVFLSEGETFSHVNILEDAGKQYYINKLNHILYATLKYEGHLYHFTFGCYPIAYDFRPFIIEEANRYSLLRFDNSNVYDDLDLGCFKLFNYKEYVELKELGLVKLSFKEYLMKLLKNSPENDQTSLYSFSSQNHSEKFVSLKRVQYLLDLEINKN